MFSYLTGKALLESRFLSEYQYFMQMYISIYLTRNFLSGLILNPKDLQS